MNTRGLPSQVKGAGLRTYINVRNPVPKGFVGSNPTPRTIG